MGSCLQPGSPHFWPRDQNGENSRSSRPAPKTSVPCSGHFCSNGAWPLPAADLTSPRCSTELMREDRELAHHLNRRCCRGNFKLWLKPRLDRALSGLG